MSGFFAMNPPNPPHWTLSLCFHKFHCVWVHLLWFRNCMKVGAKWCELVQLLQKFVPWIHVRIFHNEPPNPPHWILNSCFGALHSVRVHLGSFRNYKKLDAKQGELVQLMRKFSPRSHVGIFSTNAPNPPYWTLNSCFGVLHSVWMHLGSFCNFMKLDTK